MLSQSKQDQETWLRRTQIAIPLSPYQFPEIVIHFHLFQYISSNFNDCQSLTMIAKDCQRSPKIAKYRQFLTSSGIYWSYWKCIEVNGNSLKLMEIDMGIGGLQFGPRVTRFPGLVFHLLAKEECWEPFS